MDPFSTRYQTLQGYLLSRAPEHAPLYERVWELVEEAHQEQYRNNGRSYLEHLLDVAEILVEWEVEPLIVLGGLLHDAVRYGRIETMEQLHGRLQQEELSAILDVANRLANHDTIVHYMRDNRRLQYIFDLMVGEVRAVLIRCANRLADLRDADAFKGEQRSALLLNTHEVYLPLLERLGIWRVREEVEDRLFQLREPEQYATVRRWQVQQQAEQGERIREWRSLVEEMLERRGLGREQTEVQIDFRYPASIFRRHLASQPRGFKALEQLDMRHLFLTHVITGGGDEAYRALGAIHACGAPGTASFRDYLAQPKHNGYAAIHTSVVLNSLPYRVCVHTRPLYQLAQKGILLPEAYDYWCGAGLPAGWEESEQAALDHFVRSLRRPQQDRLSLLTPRGDLIDLPEGATVLDFAYWIHTDLGRQTGSAFVNGKPASLYARLHSGDVVEIHKDLGRKWPEPEWLDWVRTSKARDAIQMQLRQRPESKGRRRIDQELRRRGRKLQAYQPRLALLAAEMGCTPDEIFIGVAQENLLAHEIVDRLLFLTNPQRLTFHHVELTEEAAARFPLWHGELILSVECCAPSPGEEIAGYHSERGIELHRADCPQLVNPARVLGLRWRVEKVEARHVDFRLDAVNRKGLINDLTQVIRRANVDIVYLEGKRRAEMDEINFTLEVTNELELGYLLDTIRSLPGVNRVVVDGQEAEAAMSDLRRYLAPPQPIILPFSPGKPVSGQGRFWGRAQEMLVIETHLNADHAVSLLVRGPRRIGKTSLLQHLNESKAVREQYRYVFVDLQHAAYRGAPDVLRLLARRLSSALGNERRVSVPSSSDFAREPLDTFLNYLTALTDAYRYTQKKILLALDEFGTLVDAVRAGQLDFRIFYMLRSVMQHSDLLTILLCTSDDIADLLEEDGVLDLLNVTKGIRLDHLDGEAAQRLIQEPLRGQVYFEPDAIAALLRVTDNHPYYLHILGANLITMLNKERRRVVYESDVEALISRHLHLNGSEFRHLWDERVEAQHWVLRALCASPAASPISPFTPERLWRRLRECNVDLSFEQLHAALDHLVRRETIIRVEQRGGSPGYYTRIELFRRWFAVHYPLHRTPTEGTSSDGDHTRNGIKERD